MHAVGGKRMGSEEIWMMNRSIKSNRNLATLPHESNDNGGDTYETSYECYSLKLLRP